jgi:glucose/arabinose dehydrogenase
MRAVLVAILGAVAIACGSGGDSAPADTTEPPPFERDSPEAAEQDQETEAGGSQERPRGVALQRIGTFSGPLYVTSPPEDRRRIYVVEQAGRIFVMRDGKRVARPFLDIRSQVLAGGERGLLSLAFAPDFEQSRLLYVDFTDRDGNTRIVEYRAETPERVDPASARLVLFQRQPESNHNGGLLLFGPDDLLYIGLGDGGGGGDAHGRRGNAQNLGTLLGKILRIDPRRSGGRAYTSPPDNPFYGRPGARREIYAYGLRNPWRFAFDRETGDLSIGDVGQNAVEEIDYVRAGRAAGTNFGWRPFEGNEVFREGERARRHVRPVLTRTHANGWCSVTGGIVVRDPRVPAMRGRYLFGDYCKDRLYSAVLRPRRARDLRRHRFSVQSVSSFGEDARGRVYVTSLSGPVYRIVGR